MDERVVRTGRDRLAANDQGHLGLQARRDIRSGAPDGCADECGPAVFGAGSKELAATLERPSVDDLDPLAALVVFSTERRRAASGGLDPFALNLRGRRT